MLQSGKLHVNSSLYLLQCVFGILEASSLIESLQYEDLVPV